MTETSFIIQNTSQTVRIVPNEVFGSCDSIDSYLNIHLYFVLRPIHKDMRYDIFSLVAQLKFQHPAQLLSEVTVPVALSCPFNEGPASATLSFKMSRESLQFIEKNRDGDLFMQIDIRIQALIKSEVPGVIPKRFYGVDYIHTDLIRLNLPIPRSVWVEKILPKINFRNLRLIEIPLSHDTLKEAYDNVIAEFNKAEKYFTDHDYDKCVAHCRSTLDAIHRNLLSNKKDGKVESSFKWLSAVTNETVTWLTGLDKATYGLASKAHHPGQTKEFSREETESIYLVILGLLNYIGHLKQ